MPVPVFCMVESCGGKYVDVLRVVVIYLTMIFTLLQTHMLLYLYVAIGEYMWRSEIVRTWP